MALRVWLPLNGSLENKGADIDGTLTGTSFGNGGKIGAKFAYSNMRASCTFPSLTGITNFSIAYWIYIDSSAAINDWADIWALTTSIGIIRDEFTSTIGNHQVIMAKDSTVGSNSYTYYGLGVGGASSAKDKWVHIAIVKNNLITKTYVNGILNSTYTNSNFESSPQSLTGLVSIGNTSSTAGKLNDFRVYDHCLSDKEVKEIAQGLILHYKLNNLYNSNGIRNYLGNSEPTIEGGFTSNDSGAQFKNIYTQYRSNNTVITTNQIATKVYTDTNGDKYRRVIFSETRDNATEYRAQLQYAWIYASAPQYANGGEDFLKNAAVGDKYAFSCDVRGSNYFTILSLSLSCSTTNNGTAKISICENTQFTQQTDLNIWHRINGIITVTQDLVDKMNSNDINRLGIALTVATIPNTTIEGQSLTVDIKKLMFEKSDIAHPWQHAPEDLGIDITKITDSSGYGNDGTIIGTIITQQDSPRYGVSTSFAASSAINCGRGAMVTDSITVNLWAKYSSYSNLVSCTEGGGWNFENNSGLTFPVYIASVGYVHIDASSRPPVANYANSWHMFTGVYDRLNKLTKLYIDGELIGTGTVSASNLIQYNGSNVIWLNAEATGSNETGSYGNAKSFSDFRIYATALSAEDILDLYHTPANIDNLGGIHGFEFTEKQGNQLATSPLTGTMTWDATNGYWIITSNTSTSSWGIGPAVGTSPKKLIPWGKTYRLTYEVYTPTAGTWNIDYNNNDVTTSLSGNDNDSNRLTSAVSIPANQWTLITYGCSNTNETKNPSHLTLYDYSTGLGPIMNNISNALTWYMRNPQWYLIDDDPVNHIYKNGVIENNFLKQDSLNSFASARDKEKALWGTNFIEK